MGQCDEAVVVFRRACGTTPNDPTAHANLGAALCWQGNQTEGERELEHALVLHPGHLEACLNLATVLRSQARTKEALDVLRSFPLGAADGRISQLITTLEAEVGAFPS